ncbi:hypothetical protein Tco_0543511 [Tanacetum coccineum]
MTILPRISGCNWEKHNCYLDAEVTKNPNYKIEVGHSGGLPTSQSDLPPLRPIPAIYIQQFWDTICYDRTDGGYKCQLDDQWFNLTKDTLKDALQIAPVNNNKDFSSPLTLSMVWAIQKKSNTYLMSLLMTCFNYSLGHHQSSSYQLCGKDVGIIHSIHPYLHGRQKESGTTYSVKEESHSHCDPKSKGTKREVFGMPIPNELITDDIRGADYYGTYLQKVAKHQRYLAGEEVSDPDSPAPKPAKSTKPKITKQAKPVAPKAATKKPQPAPTKPKEKKRKQAKESTEATPPAKQAKAGKVAKKRTLKRSQQLVDEFVDEGIPLTEPGFGDLEADMQRAIEESLKDAHGDHRWFLSNCGVQGKTDTGKVSSTSRGSGKGKEKFRKCPPIVKSGALDEGQARPNPGIKDEGQARPNPGNDTVSQTLSTPGAHARPNLEHTDADATDAINQPQPR